MGIKHLWTIFQPLCERKSIYELKDKKLAIDLSCWICEAQNITEYQIQPKMYLRNLYFRTCFLLLLDVAPVFVLEGKAPELKYETIQIRNAIQFKGARPKNNNNNSNNDNKGKGVLKDRTRFNFTLKQCEELLKLMGLICLRGKGEAEELCSHLNLDGLVDGVISQDSDCFAYGARIVYRNFTINNTKGGGTVDLYNMNVIEDKLQIGRNKIIIMALLCGCDYTNGINGIGKDTLLKFYENYNDNEIIEQFKKWRENSNFYNKLQENIEKNCKNCSHIGTVQKHKKNGCQQCKTIENCKNDLLLKNELQMRKKILQQDLNFPNENLINEFLIKKNNINELNLEWLQPDLINFVKFTVKYLQWTEMYACEKFLPILIRWQLKYSVFNEKCKNIFFPKMIMKKRKPKGIVSYEILWYDKYNYFNNLISEEQLNEIKNDFWITIEPEYLIEKNFPNLIDDFNKKNEKKSKKPTKRHKLNKLNELMLNCSITESPPIKKKTKTIDKYFSKTNDLHLSQSNLNEQIINQLQLSPETRDLNISQLQFSPEARDYDVNQSQFSPETRDCNVNQLQFSSETRDYNVNQLKVNEENACALIESDFLNETIEFDLNQSKFGDETNNSDLSYLIDNLIERNQEKQMMSSNSFFLCYNKNNNNNCDLFEKTMEKIDLLSDSENEDDDSFNDYLTYVPLKDRIKMLTTSNTTDTNYPFF